MRSKLNKKKIDDLNQELKVYTDTYNLDLSDSDLDTLIPNLIEKFSDKKLAYLWAMDLTNTKLDSLPLKRFQDFFSACPSSIYALTLKNTGLGKRKIEELSSVFSHFRYFNALHLQQNSLVELGHDALIHFLNILPGGIVYLNLSDNNLFQLGIDKLISLFKALPQSLTRLDLSKNGLDQCGLSGLSSLFSILPKSITCLDLCGNELYKLATLPKIPKHVNYLGLKNNNFWALTAPEFSALFTSISTHTKTISLENNKLYRVKGENWQTLLASIPSQIKIDWANNKLYKMKSEELAKAFQSSRATDNLFIRNQLHKMAGSELGKVLAAASSTQEELILGPEFYKIPQHDLINAWSFLPPQIKKLAWSENDLGQMSGDDLAHLFKITPKQITTLGLNSTNLSNFTAEQLAIAFRAIPETVTTIHLGNNQLDKLGGKALGFALYNLPPSIKLVDLSENSLGHLGEDLVLACKGLRVGLHTLRLHKNLLGSLAGKVLGKALSALPESLGTLDLSQNFLVATDLNSAFAKLPPQLSQLSLIECDFGLSPSSLVAAVECLDPAINLILINNFKADNLDADKLGQLIANWPAKNKSPYLACNSLYHLKGAGLAKALGKITKQTELVNLFGNRLGTLTGSDLEQVIRAIPDQVSCLDLGNNELLLLPSREWAAFKALKPTIQILHLRENNLARKGGVYLADVIKQLPSSLRILDLRNNELHHLKGDLGIVLKNLPYIPELCLIGNHLGWMEYKELALSLAQLPESFKSIDLSYNDFEQYTFEELITVFKSIPPHIKTVYVANQDFSHLTLSELVNLLKLFSEKMELTVLGEFSSNLKMAYQLIAPPIKVSEDDLSKPTSSVKNLKEFTDQLSIALIPFLEKQAKEESINRQFKAVFDKKDPRLTTYCHLMCKEIITLVNNFLNLSSERIERAKYTLLDRVKNALWSLSGAFKILRVVPHFLTEHVKEIAEKTLDVGTETLEFSLATLELAEFNHYSEHIFDSKDKEIRRAHSLLFELMPTDELRKTFSDQLTLKLLSKYEPILNRIIDVASIGRFVKCQIDCIETLLALLSMHDKIKPKSIEALITDLYLLLGLPDLKPSPSLKSKITLTTVNIHHLKSEQEKQPQIIRTRYHTLVSQSGIMLDTADERAYFNSDKSNPAITRERRFLTTKSESYGYRFGTRDEARFYGMAQIRTNRFDQTPIAHALEDSLSTADGANSVTKSVLTKTAQIQFSHLTVKQLLREEIVETSLDVAHCEKKAMQPTTELLYTRISNLEKLVDNLVHENRELQKTLQHLLNSAKLAEAPNASKPIRISTFPTAFYTADARTHFMRSLEELKKVPFPLNASIKPALEDSEVVDIIQTILGDRVTVIMPSNYSLFDTGIQHAIPYYYEAIHQVITQKPWQKPILMPLLTKTTLLEAGSDHCKVLEETHNASHWMMMVIYPPHFLVNGYSKSSNHIDITLFNSFLKCVSLPDKFSNALTKGFTKKILTEDQAFSNKLPPLFEKICWQTIGLPQQVGDRDCGYWTSYNGIMAVSKGEDWLKNQFTEESSASAYALHKLFSKDGLALLKPLKPKPTSPSVMRSKQLAYSS